MPHRRIRIRAGRPARRWRARSCAPRQPHATSAKRGAGRNDRPPEGRHPSPPAIARPPPARAFPPLHGPAAAGAHPTSRTVSAPSPKPRAACPGSAHPIAAAPSVLQGAPPSKRSEIRPRSAFPRCSPPHRRHTRHIVRKTTGTASPSARTSRAPTSRKQDARIATSCPGLPLPKTQTARHRDAKDLLRAISTARRVPRRSEATRLFMRRCEMTFRGSTGPECAGRWPSSRRRAGRNFNPLLHFVSGKRAAELPVICRREPSARPSRIDAAILIKPSGQRQTPRRPVRWASDPSGMLTTRPTPPLAPGIDCKGQPPHRRRWGASSLDRSSPRAWLRFVHRAKSRAQL